ncbi:hypothetical protein [Aeromicrobium marinum]|nr:hypothetical protein [Aeromicrobium marinum]
MADEPAPVAPRSSDEIGGPWVRRAVLVAVALVVALVVWKLSGAFFPRWWAQRVSDQVQGDLTQGVWRGLFVGFVFSVVPLLVLFQVRRRFLSWAWRGVLAAVAVVLATPNWMTLAIAIGDSNAARAGSRIMDTEAPGFRNASLAGVLVGVLVAVLLSGSSIWLSHRKKQVRSLKGELRQRRDDESAEPPERPADS